MWGVLVLVGGNSNRMKENKALMPLGDKPLLLHVIEKFLGLDYEIKVVIGNNDEIRKYSTLLPSTVVLLKDCVEDKGPLAGMFAGMRYMHSKYTLVLPCDSPFIKREVLEYLLSVAQGADADAVIPRWPNEYLEPLHAVYKVSSVIPAIEAALRQEKLFIIDMIRQLDRVVYVDTDKIKKFDQELITFFNINSQEDFKKAEELFSRL